MKSIGKTLAVLALVVSASGVHAQTASAPAATGLKFVGQVAYGIGGEKLVAGNYSNGDSWSIRAGQGLELSVGAELPIQPDWSARLTMGWQQDTTNAKNGSVKFTRYPIELLGIYKLNEQWRLGAGLHKSNSPKLTSSGAASFGNYEFEASGGLTLMAQYKLGPATGGERRWSNAIEVRFIQEKFKLKGSMSDSASGNHVAVGWVVSY